MTSTTIHVWELIEVELTRTVEAANPYTEVEVWVDLTGPGFSRRVYGFWDGGRRHLVRLVATAPGEWSWTSGSSLDDPGLCGRRGTLVARVWSDAELAANPCRRGFLRPTTNGHGFCYSDGTPYFLLGDTWWAGATFRHPWVDVDHPMPEWPEHSFQELVAARGRQGFNAVAMIAAFPHWGDDGRPSSIVMDDGTPLRQAWQTNGQSESSDSARAKQMHNEGGRPFLFPGNVPGFEDVVPDFDRINPDYFRYLDLRVACLNENGMIPFIEASRRDIGPVWKKYYDWPESYARYVHYLFCRYHAFNVLLSPIHYDFEEFALESREYNEPANLVIDRFGPPPFGTLVGTNAAPSTLVNYGGSDEAHWLTFHQLGNWRTHDNYWYLTEIYRSEPPMPAIDGEPYYPGFPDDNPPAPSEKAARYCRSGIYGSLLSGAFAGYIYGAEGLWGGNVEPESKYTITDALGYQSGDQVRHLLRFIGACDGRQSELVPEPELLLPSRSGEVEGYEGWSYCAYLPGRCLLLLYFEAGTPETLIRSVLPKTEYEFTWFDPRTGEWGEAMRLTTSQTGRTPLPARPTSEDWAARMEVI